MRAKPEVGAMVSRGFLALLSALVISASAVPVPSAGDHAPTVAFACTAQPGSAITFEPPLSAVRRSGFANLSVQTDACAFGLANPGCGPGSPPCLIAGFAFDSGEQAEQWEYEGDCAVAELTQDPPAGDDEFEVFGGAVAQFRRVDPATQHEQVLTLLLQPDAVCNVASAAITAASYVANAD